MAHADTPHDEPRLSTLVGEIVSDAQSLIRKELHLARTEMTQEAHKAKDAAISLGAGAGMLAWGTALLTLMVVFLITWATNGAIPLWGSFGILGGIFLIAGAILFFVARSRAGDIHLVPPQTAQTLSENMQWIKNRT
jgi:hypothetical protein